MYNLTIRNGEANLIRQSRTQKHGSAIVRFIVMLLYILYDDFVSFLP